MNDLPDILETREPVREATGFVFTEGPLWSPDGFFYFNDTRPGTLYRMHLGEAPVEIRKTVGGNGLTFDLEGRLIHCEGEAHAVTRTSADGVVETLVESYRGGRLNRPNDVVCRSDGSIYFTDPSMRIPFALRAQPGPDGDDGVWAGARVYRVRPNGAVSVLVDVEYPNGLAFSPDERILYIANTRMTEYIHAIDLDADGEMAGRRIFADMNIGEKPGIPDGMKVDERGRIFCTGAGGIWVFEADGRHIGTIRLPEMAVNLAFGGDDLRTLFVCAVTSVYTLRVKTPGLPTPYHQRRIG